MLFRSMTPEQLEEIPEVSPEMVQQIQSAVVSYYGQFETAETAVAESPNVPENESVTIENAETSEPQGQ